MPPSFAKAPHARRVLDAGRVAVPHPPAEMAAVTYYSDQLDDDFDVSFYDDDDEGEEEKKEEGEEEVKEDDEGADVDLAGITYEEGKALLAEALDLDPSELRDVFDGHADYLHDEPRNAAYRRAIDIAAKDSK